MNTTPKSPTIETDDPAFHKGAIEGDRPDDEQNFNHQGAGIGPDGLPDNPKASAEDKVGANVDETQG